MVYETLIKMDDLQVPLFQETPNLMFLDVSGFWTAPLEDIGTLDCNLEPALLERKLARNRCVVEK